MSHYHYRLNPNALKLAICKAGSQKALEELLNLPVSTVSKWKSGSQCPQGDRLEALTVLTGFPEKDIRLLLSTPKENAPKTPSSPTEGQTSVPLSIINDKNLTWAQRGGYAKLLSLPKHRREDFPAYNHLPHKEKSKATREKIYKTLQLPTVPQNTTETISIPNSLINNKNLSLDAIGMMIFLLANPPKEAGGIRKKLVQESPAQYRLVNKLAAELIEAGEITEERVGADFFSPLVWKITRLQDRSLENVE